MGVSVDTHLIIGANTSSRVIHWLTVISVFCFFLLWSQSHSGRWQQVSLALGSTTPGYCNCWRWTVWPIFAACRNDSRSGGCEGLIIIESCMSYQAYCHSDWKLLCSWLRYTDIDDNRQWWSFGHSLSGQSGSHTADILSFCWLCS